MSTDFVAIVAQINDRVADLIRPHKCTPLTPNQTLLHELNAAHAQFATELLGKDDEKALSFAINSIVSQTAAHRLAEIRQSQLFSNELKILENPTIETTECEITSNVAVSTDASCVYQNYVNALSGPA